MSGQIRLEEDIFATIIQYAPLVSIDLCVVRGDELLLCMRDNEPAKGFWFTPGGRIFKGECWSAALKRVATTEIGLDTEDLKPLLMGIWDHFYDNSVFRMDVSTHYVNLPHLLCVSPSFSPELDSQHTSFLWVNMKEAHRNKLIHPYASKYIEWILSR